MTTPAGQRIPTGTVGALLVNIKLYDEAHAKGDEEGMSRLGKGLTAPISTLKTVGLFDLFPADEWMAGGGPGRKLVGRQAKEMGF